MFVTRECFAYYNVTRVPCYGVGYAIDLGATYSGLLSFNCGTSKRRQWDLFLILDGLFVVDGTFLGGNLLLIVRWVGVTYGIRSTRRKVCRVRGGFFAKSVFLRPFFYRVVDLGNREVGEVTPGDHLFKRRAGQRVEYCV